MHTRYLDILANTTGMHLISKPNKYTGISLNTTTQYAIAKRSEIQPSCKKVCGLEEGYCEKRCEIQGGGQEMTVMVKILILTILIIITVAIWPLIDSVIDWGGG